MSNLFLYTKTTPSRISSGQPTEETIEIENLIYMNSLTCKNYIETIRFPNAIKHNDSPVRYYHLLEETNGLALCIPNDRDAIARSMHNFYTNRKLKIRPSKIIPIDKFIKNGCDFSIAQFASHMYISTHFNQQMILRINCIENFNQNLVFNAAIRVPSIISQNNDVIDHIINANKTINGTEVIPFKSDCIDFRFMLRVNA